MARGSLSVGATAMSKICTSNGNFHPQGNLLTLSERRPEEEFINSFEEYLERGILPQWGTKDTYRCVREFALHGYGIADIVIVPKFHSKRIPKTTTLLLKISSSPSLSRLILHLASNGNADKKILTDKIGVSEKVLRSFLNLLSSYISVNDQRQSVLHLGNIVPRFEMWVLEAKISDWKKALNQAYRYASFANRTIVLLPDKTATNAKKRLSLFKKLKVGLWSFDSVSAHLSVLYTPPVQNRRHSEANLRARALACAAALHAA